MIIHKDPHDEIFKETPANVHLILSEHMKHFQFTALPPLPLNIQFIQALDRIYKKDRIRTKCHTFLHLKPYLKSYMRILAQGIRII